MFGNFRLNIFDVSELGSDEPDRFRYLGVWLFVT